MIQRTNKEIAEFQERTRKFACCRGREKDKDDFAQEAAIAFISREHVNIDWALTDYLRKIYGEIRRKSGKLRASESNVSLDQPLDLDSESTLGDTIPAPEIQTEAPYDSEIVHANLTNHIVAKLYEDMSPAEVGEVFGVSESRISQRMKVVKAERAKVATIQHIFDIYKDDKEYSKLEINWIRI